MPLHADVTEEERAAADQYVVEHEARKILVAAAPVRFLDVSSGATFATTRPAFTPTPAQDQELDGLLAALTRLPRSQAGHKKTRGHYGGVCVDRGPRGWWRLHRGVAELHVGDAGPVWFHDPQRAVERWVVLAAHDHGFAREARQMDAPWSGRQ